ncbi:hypothetical protein [Neobacillus niacini]|uniref:hypothetical protein n=1 Tax=Neobacillus niacini TaxID=86668 RepID=UPI0021CB5313|nr:hypothetical protein [Neobacillus niacini]MCM3767457.1 hypothetical protein [Neobacillus niacini]
MTRKVYILLTDTRSILTRLIKLYTKKPLNHASIVLDDHFSKVYSFGRIKPRNPFFGGFVQENIRSGLFRDADCAIFCCTLTEQQFLQLKDKIQKMEENKHAYKYNFIGLFAVMLNREYNRKNAFFCSHFVAALLQESGVPISEQKPLSLITPYDIKESPSLELLFEGKLSSYVCGKQTIQEKPQSVPRRIYTKIILERMKAI